MFNNSTVTAHAAANLRRETATDAPNPFRSSAPTKRRGFVVMVDQKCRCCSHTKQIETDHFRLRWMCDDCKLSPILMRVISKFMSNS